MRRMAVVLILLALGASTCFAEATDRIVQVTVHKLRNDRGKVGIALFSGPQGFPKKSERAHAAVFADIKDGAAQAEFKAVPIGEYAVAVFHDEDSNGKLKYGTLGIPAEGYGFSNNPTSFFGPPSFGAAKFPVKSPRTIVDIDISY